MEGRTNPVRFRLPKGGFRVLLDAHDPVKEAAAAAPSGRWRTAALAMAAAAVASTAAVIALLVRTPRAPDMPEEVRAFWTPFFRADRPPLLVVGPNLFVHMDGVIVRDWTVNRWEDVAASERMRAIQQALRAPRAVHMPIYMGAGEARAMFAIGRLFFRAGYDLQLRQSNEISWSDFRDRAVVLLGSSKSIPHISELPDLGVELAFAADLPRIRVLHPRPGEPAGYHGARNPGNMQVTTAYGLITRLVARRGRGELLEISSPDTEGALAAADYVSSVEGIRELLGKMGGVGGSFQAIVKANVKDRVPIRVAYETHRLLADPEP